MLSEKLKEVRNLSNKIQCTIEREDPKRFSNNVLVKCRKLIYVFVHVLASNPSSVQLWVAFFSEGVQSHMQETADLKLAYVKSFCSPL